MAKRSGAGGERACAAREAWQWGASGRASRASRSRRCAAVVLERDMVSQEDRGRRSLGRLASVKWRVLFGSPRAPVLYARGADNADGEWIDSSREMSSATRIYCLFHSKVAKRSCAGRTGKNLHLISRKSVKTGPSDSFHCGRPENSESRTFLTVGSFLSAAPLRLSKLAAHRDPKRTGKRRARVSEQLRV